jgi:hypothetical protein
MRRVRGLCCGRPEHQRDSIFPFVSVGLPGERGKCHMCSSSNDSPAWAAVRPPAGPRRAARQPSWQPPVAEMRQESRDARSNAPSPASTCSSYRSLARPARCTAGAEPVPCQHARARASLERSIDCTSTTLCIPEPVAMCLQLVIRSRHGRAASRKPSEYVCRQISEQAAMSCEPRRRWHTVSSCLSTLLHRLSPWTLRLAPRSHHPQRLPASAPWRTHTWWEGSMGSRGQPPPLGDSPPHGPPGLPAGVPAGVPPGLPHGLPPGPPPGLQPLLLPLPPGPPTGGMVLPAAEMCMWAGDTVPIGSGVCGREGHAAARSCSQSQAAGKGIPGCGGRPPAAGQLCVQLMIAVDVRHSPPIALPLAPVSAHWVHAQGGQEPLSAVCRPGASCHVLTWAWAHRDRDRAATQQHSPCAYGRPLTKHPCSRFLGHTCGTDSHRRECESPDEHRA